MSSWKADWFSEDKTRKLLKKKKHSFPERNSTPKLQFASGSRPNLVLERTNRLPVLCQDRWLSDISFVHVTRTSGSFVTQNFDNTNDVSLLSYLLPYLLLACTCLMLFAFLYVVRVLHVVLLFYHPFLHFLLFILTENLIILSCVILVWNCFHNRHGHASCIVRLCIKIWGLSTNVARHTCWRQKNLLCSGGALSLRTS